jgi:hypothetical protein
MSTRILAVISPAEPWGVLIFDSPLKNCTQSRRIETQRSILDWISSSAILCRSPIPAPIKCAADWHRYSSSERGPGSSCGRG